MPKRRITCILGAWRMLIRANRVAPSDSTRCHQADVSSGEVHHLGVRDLAELINADEDAWPQILDWRAAATRQVDIVSSEPEAGRRTLLALQITTRSPMGAIALRCGGLLIDGGWLRILGASSGRIGGGLREWNASLGGVPLDPPLDGALVIAYDALGGFFALNGDRWEGPTGSLHYLAPDTYEWQGFDLGYSDSLVWAMSDRLDDFYQGYRWPGWQAEVEALGPDQALSIYPPLGFETTSIDDRARAPVPARELWTFHHELGRQLSQLPPGAEVELDFR